MIPAHGTYARYQVERRTGQTPCVLCQTARNMYMNAYRRGGVQRALQQACTELAAAHPGEFEEILGRKVEKYAAE